jgi:hypothetical protein
VLTQLDADLERTLTVVRNGIRKLQMDQQYRSVRELEPIDEGMVDS